MTRFIPFILKFVSNQSKQFQQTYFSCNIKMKESILETLKKDSLSEKKLRKALWKVCKEQYDEEDEFDQKFQLALKSLLKKEKITGDSDEYSLKSNAKAVEKRKREPVEDDVDENERTTPATKAPIANKTTKVTSYEELWKTGEQRWRDNGFDQEYLRTNPERITRLFCGNLNKKITEEEMKKCISGVSYIKWITDKTTGEFYGSTFLEMKDPDSAAMAVMQDKSKFMGRPLKIYYCPPRPGDIWPPQEGMGGRGNGPPTGKPGANGPPRREKTAKPTGCKKLYAGNLSYNIDDDTMCDFFKDCGTIAGLRWLTHKGSEEFRGCGFIEFSTTEEADEAMKLDGKELLGRPLILDWTN